MLIFIITFPYFQMAITGGPRVPPVLKSPAAAPTCAAAFTGSHFKTPRKKGPMIPGKRQNGKDMDFYADSHLHI